MTEIAGIVYFDDTKKTVAMPRSPAWTRTAHPSPRATRSPSASVSRSWPATGREGRHDDPRAHVPAGYSGDSGRDGHQNYLISEVQKVYRLQGVEINDKHIEVIVRQMCARCRMSDSGSTDLIGGASWQPSEVKIINADLQKRIDAGEERSEAG